MRTRPAPPWGCWKRGWTAWWSPTATPAMIKKIARLVKEASPPVTLTTARITRLKPLGMGDRVCVDTCSNLGLGEGMLVGNSSGGLFLVHAESLENPYVAPRPFRVNAGPVHAYIRVTGDKTRYLGELAAGDEVLVVNHQGRTTPAVVGRVKVERRPLMLVAADGGRPGDHHHPAKRRNHPPHPAQRRGRVHCHLTTWG